MADEERVDDVGPFAEYDESGVDVSLVRWMLSLTPLERLRMAQEWANLVLKVRELNGIG
jgi:hypothetical protein